MNFWRMALRVGEGGESLWEQCRSNGVATLTYDPIHHVDLGPFADGPFAPGWNKLRGSQHASMRHFAWNMKAGDGLFIREAGLDLPMVGFGHIKGVLGERAYRFAIDSPIHDQRGLHWHHLLDVDWDDRFLNLHIGTVCDAQEEGLNLSR
jgi:hypothetical protein